MSDKKISLECCLKAALDGNGFQCVDDALKMKPSEIDCRSSEHLLSILDKIVNVDLHTSKHDQIGLVMRCICYFSIPSNEDFSLMFEQGLIQKMLKWFEYITEMDTSDAVSVESFTTLIEDVFDAIVAVSDYSSKGNREVVNAFLLPASLVVKNNAFHFAYRIEAIRSLNMLLKRTNKAVKRQLSSTANVQKMIMESTELLPIAGDYEMQVSLVEFLFRLNSEKSRHKLAHIWFKNKQLETHFTSIKDSEFETDCRKFLNDMNNCLKEKQSVYSLPCVCVNFDEYQLRKPNDKMLEEFWIDFNIGSHRISFFATDESQPSQDPLWETISIPEEIITKYSLETKIQGPTLAIYFSKNITLCNLEGNCVRIDFKNDLNVMDIVCKVYGNSKCENLKTKMKPSEAKMLALSSRSQLVVSVPDSQIDLSSEIVTSDPKYTTDHNNWSKHIWPQVQIESRTTLHDCVAQQHSSGPMIGFSGTSKTASGSLTATPRSKTNITLPLEFTSSSKKQHLLFPAGDFNTRTSNTRTLEDLPREIVPDTSFIDHSGQSKIHFSKKTNVNNRKSLNNNVIAVVEAPGMAENIHSQENIEDSRQLSIVFPKRSENSKQVRTEGDKAVVTVREESKSNTATLKNSLTKNPEPQAIKRNVMDSSFQKSTHTPLPNIQDINEIRQNEVSISRKHVWPKKLSKTQVNGLPSTTHTTTTDDATWSDVGKTDENLPNEKPALSELKLLRNEKETHKLPASTSLRLCKEEHESNQLEDVNANGNELLLCKERSFANRKMSKKLKHNLGSQLKKLTCKELMSKKKSSTLFNSQCNESIPESQMSWLLTASKTSTVKARFYRKKIVKKMPRIKREKLNQRMKNSHEQAISTKTDLKSMNISSDCGFHMSPKKLPCSSRSVYNSGKSNKNSLKDIYSDILPAQSAAKTIKDPHRDLIAEKKPNKSIEKNTVLKDQSEKEMDLFLSLRSFSETSQEEFSSRTVNKPIPVQKNVKVDKGAHLSLDVNKVTMTYNQSYFLKPDDSVEKPTRANAYDEIEDCYSPNMNPEMSSCLTQDYDISPTVQSNDEGTNEFVSPKLSPRCQHSLPMVKRNNYKKVVCRSPDSGPCYPPQASRLSRKRKRGATEDVFAYQSYGEQTPKSIGRNALLPQQLLKLPTGEPSPTYNLECEGMPSPLYDEDNEHDINVHVEESIAGVMTDFGNAVKKGTMNKFEKIAKFTRNYVSIAVDHMKNIWSKMKERRTRQLDGFQQIIADELSNAKKDINLLNSLEEKSTKIFKEQLHVTANVRERQYKRFCRIKNALMERFQRCSLNEDDENMMHLTLEVLDKTMATEQRTLLKGLQNEDMAHAQAGIYKAFLYAVKNK